MTSILIAIFALSMALSLVLSPLVREFAANRRLFDKPSQRKVHSYPIPILGGVAIYLAFCLPFVLSLIYPNQVQHILLLHRQQALGLLLGGSLVFGLGLWDDLAKLTPAIKFAGQILAALFAYYVANIRIEVLAVQSMHDLPLGWLSMPVTVLWFLLVTNAINLIDGLDGLAAGVTFFASLILMILCFSSNYLLASLGFAALAGTTLGFLRYNFNPASIFMGDSGSYFLGFTMAALSILASMKSHATVAILIPIIALGLPLFDVILAPIRRFIVGKDMFKPDKEHVHHRLIKMGFDQRKAVLIMYGITIFMGLLALMQVYLKDIKIGFTLFVLGLAVFLGIRKLGYFEYWAVDKIIGYFHDVADEMGLKKGRRTFLNRQIAISQASSLDDLWAEVLEALQVLRVDEANLILEDADLSGNANNHYSWADNESVQDPEDSQHRMLRIELPLVNLNKSYGMLVIKKDILQDQMSHYTLHRIEHLRRTIVRRLNDLEVREKKDSDRVNGKSARG
jgi:UDP-GlcNAc:undecaprenyl-phosphate GlcNAc-1-phosphate transferase